MAKKQPLNIAGLNFDTKKSATAYVQRILNENELNQPLKDDEFAFILELLKNHPRHKEKLGCGIKTIITRLETEHGGGNRQFFIIRKDGTGTDFSFLQCINGIKKSLSLFKEAARNAVKEQIIDFKEDYFKQNQDTEGRVACQETSVLVNRNECDVDHHPTGFNYLVESYITDNDIDVSAVGIAGFEDGEQSKRFVDLELAKDFADYHNANASLRIVTKQVNLRKKKK